MRENLMAQTKGRRMNQMSSFDVHNQKLMLWIEKNNIQHWILNKNLLLFCPFCGAKTQ